MTFRFQKRDKKAASHRCGAGPDNETIPTIASNATDLRKIDL